MTVDTIQQTATGIEIEVGLTPEMEEVKEENTKDLEQVKDTLTGMNSVIGHTTHRCFKLVDYLKRKGKKIILHEEEVQELAQAVQNLNLKLNSLKVRNSTNY